MRSAAETQRVTRPGDRAFAPARYEAVRSPSHAEGMAAKILGMQQALGNQTVQQMAATCPAFPSACPTDGACHTCPVRLQAKLAISQPGDPYEQEADRVAEAVMRMPGPPISRVREWDQGRQGEGETATLQRKCAACASGQGLCPQCAEEERMQRKPLAAQITPLVQRQVTEEPDAKKSPAGSRSIEGEESVPPIVYEVLRSPGQPLDAATRAFFEPRFGFDFSRVRVHSDAQAAESARAINALAYTVGPDVVFGAGQYAPGMSGSRKLLAHELTHVVQQGAGKVQTGDACFIQKVPASTPHGKPYTPGVHHDHRPSGRWSDIQAIEKRSCSVWSKEGGISCVCAIKDPKEVLDLAFRVKLSKYPLAQKHLTHYLSGTGADYTEDVTDFITRDSGVRGKLASSISAAPMGYFKVKQNDYAEHGFRLSFGAIDRIDYEVDAASSKVHVWFADNYEWHPYYPGIYTPMPGDVKRETNCVHAAAVELKAKGAADFWMVGYGTIDLSSVKGSTVTGGGTRL
jgi:hypothetical protein